MTAVPTKAALEAAIAVIVRWTASSDRKQCAEIIQTALDEARAEERRKVVEWLNAEADQCRADMSADPKSDMAPLYGQRMTYFRQAAGLIRKGEHLKAQEKQG